MTRRLIESFGVGAGDTSQSSAVETVVSTSSTNICPFWPHLLLKITQTLGSSQTSSMEPKLTRHFFILRHFPLFSHFHPQNQIQDEGGEEQREKQVKKSCWKSFGSSVGFLNHAWVERYKLRLTRHHQGRCLFYFNQQARPSVLLVSVLSQGLSTHNIPQPWPPGQMSCHQKSSPYCSIFPKPCFFPDINLVVTCLLPIEISSWYQRNVFLFSFFSFIIVFPEPKTRAAPSQAASKY